MVAGTTCMRITFGSSICMLIILKAIRLQVRLTLTTSIHRCQCVALFTIWTLILAILWSLNHRITVSDISRRHGACRHRQPDEVRPAIHRHRSIHKAALSHRDWQARVLLRRPFCMERSPSVTPHHHRLETF
jgi:hypothetical protein